MMPIYSNNARSTLSKICLQDDMTLELASASKFPVPVSGQLYVLLTLENSIGHIEVVKASALTGRVYTLIERGLQGTWAQEWPAGTLIENRFTAENINDINTFIESNLDAMTNKSFTETTTQPIVENDRIVAIKVFSGAVQLFDRVVTYYPDGRVDSVTTDDLINKKRLIKTVTYTNNVANVSCSHQLI